MARKLEIEAAKPMDWESEVILERTASGSIARIEAPDAEEGGEGHAADD